LKKPIFISLHDGRYQTLSNKHDQFILLYIWIF
jgi:hypothetical protein